MAEVALGQTYNTCLMSEKTPSIETATPVVDENQLIAERRDKLKALRERHRAGGAVPFPNDFKPEHRAAPLQAQYAEVTNETLEPQAINVSVAGRMMLKRMMGKASFCTLQDATGRIQLRVTVDNVGPDVYDAFKHWDLGDILGGALEAFIFLQPAHQLGARIFLSFGGPGRSRQEHAGLDLGERSGKVRVKLLLDYLSRHERGLIALLA